MPPPLRGLLESALYSADLPTARDFYRGVLGAEVLLESDRLVALSLPGPGVLLLFRRGASDEALPTPGGLVPGHGASGVQHLAFAVDAQAVAGWRAHLHALGVPIESEVRWPRGGTSLYVRDPDGHSIEFATPGLWATY
jgi:catechol 2,3-dioxygenase-like lactoylglutathione lyase family enzyme